MVAPTVGNQNENPTLNNVVGWFKTMTTKQKTLFVQEVYSEQLAQLVKRCGKHHDNVIHDCQTLTLPYILGRLPVGGSGMSALCKLCGTSCK
jgi:hypothetical protein